MSTVLDSRIDPTVSLKKDDATTKTTTTKITSTTNIRLSKLLSQHATNVSMSRKQSDKLIQTGHVTIAGKIAEQSSHLINMHDLMKHCTPTSTSPWIKVQGKPIMFDLSDWLSKADSCSSTPNFETTPVTPKVWAVHKLAGEVVAERDPHGRLSLIDRLNQSGVGRQQNNKKKHSQTQKRLWHLKPIGRLDIPTEGLILVTDSGEFAREMELPINRLHRVYRARVHGKLTLHKLQRIRNGGVVYDTTRYGPMHVAVERPSRRGTSLGSTNTWVYVTCTEGKNRQIRNVFAALGLTVTRLIRIAYGDYNLDDIPKGMAIPVPYKAIEKQKKRGILKGERPSQKRPVGGTCRQNKHKVGTTKAASPVQWVNSVQARPMSTKTMISTEEELANESTYVEEGQLASQQVLKDSIVSLFPKEHIVYSFGYGSGIFSQTLNGASHKHEGMLDLILVVNDTYRFHQENLQIFPHHYTTWLRWGGASLVTKVQRQFPLKDARVLFHVVDDPVQMKYGVVDQRDLIKDLNEWESLYLAGRLHKPTLPLVDSPSDEFLDAQHRNLQAATAAALLLICISDDHRHECTVSFSEFCRTIASLSYMGDFRMRIGGEDPQKLDKLVEAPGQLLRFRQMYLPFLEALQQSDGVVSCSVKNGIMDEMLSDETCTIEWDTSSALEDTLPKFLPASIQRELSFRNTASSGRLAEDLSKILAVRVAPIARHQSFKGIFTLGFRKSMEYDSAKLAKRLFRKRKR